MIGQTIYKGLAEMNQALDGTEALCKVNHISEFAEYDQDPLDKKMGVISSLSRKYLDLIVKFDRLMPMLATLEIGGVVKKKELDVRVAGYKKLVKRVAYSTRELASGLRKHMNQLAEQEKEGLTPTEAKGAGNAAVRPVKEGTGHTNASRDVIASQGTEAKAERDQIVPQSRGDHAPVVHEVSP